MSRILSNIFKSLLAILIWPAICIGVLFVDMVFIWKTDTLTKPKPSKPVPAAPIDHSNHNCTHEQHGQEHMDVAGGNPTKVATDNTGKIDWDEVSVYYPYKNGNS